MTPWSTFPVEFGGGLISNMNPLQQGLSAVGSATTLQNFEPSKEGGYKKVLGYEKYIDDEVTGTGPLLCTKVLNPEKVLTARRNASDVTEYWINSGGFWSSLGSATFLGGRVSAADFNFDGTHRVILVDGSNSPAIFEDGGDTLSFPSDYPSDVIGGEFVAVYKNTVFISKGNSLSFSAPYSYTDFTPANGGGVISVGHEITGLTVFRDQLVVFSRNKIQRLVGSSIADFQLVPITDNIGCISGWTIQEVGGDIMFLAPDGLRLLGATERIGDFGLEVASSVIERDTRSFVDNATSFASVVIRGKAQYRIFGYAEATSQNTSEGLLMTKFSDQGASRVEWAKTKGIKAYVSDSRYVPDQEISVFGNEDGYVYKMEVGSSFDGDPIEAIYQSPFMPIDDPSIRKTLYKMSLYTDILGIFSVDVNILFDMYKISNYNSATSPDTITLESNNAGVSIYGNPSTVYGQATYGSVLDRVYNSPVIGSGKTFALKIEDNSTNPSFSLDTALFEYRAFDRK